MHHNDAAAEKQFEHCQWNCNVFNSSQKLNNGIDMSIMCGGQEFQVAGLA